MVVYSIVNKKTKLYLGGVGVNLKKKPYVAWYWKDPIYYDLRSLERSIEKLFHKKVQSELDKCEIVAYKYQPTKTTVNLKKMKDRIGQKFLVKKLKGE